MRLLIQYIICFVIAFNVGSAKNVIINSVETQKYPHISIEAYFYEDNFRLIQPSNGDFDVFENSISIDDYSIECSSSENYPPRSFIFSLDVSLSMKNNDMELAFDIIDYLTDNILILNPNSEILIQGASNLSYIISDFSSDKSEIMQSLVNIENYGYNDYNSALIDSDNGSLFLADNANYKTSVILISNGKSIADKERIINIANEKNLKIFSINLLNSTPKEIAEISNETGGNYFSQINNINKTFNKIIYGSYGNSPCTITYLSDNCGFERNVKIETLSDNHNENFSISPGLFTYIDFPKDNYLSFSDASEMKSIELKAVNSDVLIRKISGDNTYFQLVSNVENYLLKQDSILELKFRYSDIDNKYRIEEFTIDADICFGTSIWCSNDKKEDISNSSLRLISPNGGEVFQARTDTVIRWTGVSPGDTVSVEFSTNNGETWIKVRNRIFAGLESSFFVPDVDSDECLVRIKQLTENQLDPNIHILDEHQNEILDIKHTSDGNYLYSADIDGVVLRWDLNSFELNKVISNNLYGLNHFDIDASGTLMAYAQNEPKIIIYHINNDEIVAELENYEGSVKRLEWQKNGSYIAGLSNNKLIIWKYPNPEPIKTIEYGSNILTDLKFSLTGNKIIVSTFEGNIHIVDLVELDTEVSHRISNSVINSIDFNATGKNIVIGTNSNEISIWNPYDSTKLKNYFDNNPPVLFSKWSKHNNYIATANSGREVKIWSLTDFVEKYTYPYHNELITALDWSPANDYIASAQANGEIHYWTVGKLPFENKPLQIDTSDFVFSIRKPNARIKNINFYPIYENTVKDTLITNFFENIGHIDIAIDSIVLKGRDAASFRLMNDFPDFIKVNNSFDVELSFLPEKSGEHIADLLIYSGFNIYRSSLIGYSLPTRFEIINQIVDFDNVNLMEIKDTTLLIFQNISGNNIDINSVELLNNNEQFEILEFSNSLNNQHYFELKVSYSPQNLTRTGEIIKINIDAKSSIYVSLKGRGVAPVINFAPVLDFGILKCGELLADTILVQQNTGTNFLRIDSMEVIGSNAFKVNQNLTGTKIFHDEELSLPVSFEPDTKSLHNARLIIYTNTMQDYENTVNIELVAFLDSIDIDFSKYEVNLTDLNKNQSYYDTIFVYNNGTGAVYFESEYYFNHFKIESDRNELAPDDSISLYISFSGESDEGQYRDVFEYFDYCGSSYKIILNALVGSSAALISTIDIIDLGDTRCDNQKTFKLDISNSGLTDLIIYDMSFSNDLFSIEENTQNVIIKPNLPIVFTISTDNTVNGENNSDLIISSNAENSVSGETIIPVKLFNDYTELNFESDTVHFYNALENINYTKFKDVVNTGTIPFEFTLPYITEYFEINQITPAKLNQNTEAIMQIEFKGGAADNKYIEYIDFTDSCGNDKRLYLYADVIGYAPAGLKTLNISASVGDTISIPVFVYSPENIDLPEVNSYSAELEFNANLLYPVNETPLGIVENKKRIIKIDDIPNVSNPDIPAASIEFLVTLGDTNFTEITINNAIANDDENMAIETIDGALFIDGICDEGGSRFVDYSGIITLEQNSPNPADQHTSIRFYLIEKGAYTLELFNIKGMKIATLDENYVDYPMEKEILLNISELATGNYLYVLNTPSHKFVRKMTVKR